MPDEEKDEEELFEFEELALFDLDFESELDLELDLEFFLTFLCLFERFSFLFFSFKSDLISSD